MKHIDVPLKLDMIISRTLEDNQDICPICHGTGIHITRTSIGVCNWCSDGTVNICKYCGEPLPKYSSMCNCQEAKEEYFNNQKEKYQMESDNRYKKASKISASEAIKKYEYLYEDKFDRLLDTSDVDILDQIVSLQESFGNIFVANPEYLTLDAYTIVENACEELHEDALDNIYSGIDDLQDMLNKWVDKNGGSATTYCPDYNFAIAPVIRP